MTKKKIEPPLKAPVTLAEFEAFVATWERMKPVLDKLAPASSGKMETRYGRTDYEYQWAEGYHGIDRTGVWFYSVEDDRYENYRSAHTYLIPITDILDPQTTIDKHNKIIGDIATTRSEQAAISEKAQYERLKAKFEK